MNKIVVVAFKKTGKTTLVNKLLQVTKRDVCGYQTVKVQDNSIKNSPLYLCPIGEKLIPSEENHVGYCGGGKHEVKLDVFNTKAVALITPKNKETLIIMDEVGFMEQDADIFKNKVFEVLKSPNPVLIMLKDKPNIKFLEDIKKFETIKLIKMNKDNRDEVFEIVKNSLT